MRILSWIAGMIGAAIVVDFALSNRLEVPIGFWPLVHELAMPAYLAILLPLLFGIVIGWVVAGFRSLKRRRAERKAAS